MRAENGNLREVSGIRYAYIFLSLIVVFSTLLFTTIKADAATVTALSPTVTAKVKGVSPSVLNVRTGPSTSYSYITTLKEGASMTVTGYTATSGGWLKMKTSSISLGYVSAEFVNVPVTGLTAAASTASVVDGSTVTIKMTVVPACATNKKLTWSSSSTSVATVSSSGVVTGKSAGTATITAKTSDGGKIATTKVTVKPIAVTGVSLDKTKLSVSVGASAAIKATVAPSNAANKTVAWTSSNTAVATVSSAGSVTGKAAGSATITAKTADGGKTATCAVTVTPIAVTGVSLDKTALAVNVDATATLVATVAPSNAANKTVSWTSSNTAIATVSSAGVITGKAVGTVTVTAITADGGRTAACKVTVNPVPVTGVTLNKTALTIEAGFAETLTPTVIPSNAGNKTVTWTSSNTLVAMVNSAGIVTANSAGFAVITVKTADGAKTAECNVTVTPSTAPVAVTGVSLGETTLSVNEGASAELAAIIEPSNATNKAVIWSSDKTSVAAVDENGVITGKAVGIAKITATTVDGEKTTSCTVTVNPPPVSDVSLDKTELSVIVGANATLKATVAPTGAVNKTVTWTSSKTSVAEVDSNGVVAGKAVGTATITATTVDGGKVAICNVTVNPVPVTGVSLSKTSLAFAVGDAVTTSALTATVAPTNAANKAVTWASSDAKIATVSSGGVVTMKSVGVATITAKTADGGKIANCAVTVKLGKPTIASVVSGGDKKVKVTWGKIASAKSYDVYAKLSTETDYTKVASGITGTSSAITIKSYAKYNFKVDAVFSNAACNSAHSGAMSFITLLAPTGLAGDSNGSAVTVSWSKAPGATSYIVYRSSAASGTYTKIGTATTLSYEDKNAVKNKQNYYKVKAHNETASYTTTSVLSSYKSVDNVLALSWPISNGSSKVTSGFGPRVSPAPGASSNHLGIDIGVPSGTSVMAAADGTVTFAGISGSLTTGYGRLIEINHGNGLVTRYGHNSSLVAKAGQKVKRGDLIAKVGSTGVSTGPHCHFEVRISGEAKNPRTYLK